MKRTISRFKTNNQSQKLKKRNIRSENPQNQQQVYKNYTLTHSTTWSEYFFQLMRYSNGTFLISLVNEPESETLCLLEGNKKVMF